MSYAAFLGHVDAGHYSKAAAVLDVDAAACVDALPLVASLYALQYASAVAGLGMGVDIKPTVALLGGASVVPAAARKSVQALAGYVADAAGEVWYGA